MKELHIQKDESRKMREKIKKVIDKGTLLTGYLTDKIDADIYYLYIPELNLCMRKNPFDLIVRSGPGRQFRLKPEFLYLLDESS